MMKYIIIEIKTGKLLNLTTKKRNFLEMLADARDYLELPKCKRELFKKWYKEETNE